MNKTPLNLLTGYVLVTKIPGEPGEISTIKRGKPFPTARAGVFYKKEQLIQTVPKDVSKKLELHIVEVTVPENAITYKNGIKFNFKQDPGIEVIKIHSFNQNHFKEDSKVI